MNSKLAARATNLGIVFNIYTSETDVVRLVQKKEGVAPCFQTNRRIICEDECEWACDCKNALIAMWKR